jgi:tetratricopeptide (TPR) repeat protein
VGRAALTQALEWVDGAFAHDPGDVRSWPTLEPLAPHVLAVTLQADAVSISEPTARLMDQLGQLLQAKVLYAGAEPLADRALAIAEASYGPEHPSVSIYLNNLAQLLKATNRLGKAEELMRRALVIDETSFGPQDPRVAMDLNNLARLLQDTNRLGEAEELMRRAFAIDEATFGPEHPNVAMSLNNLAGLLKVTNRLGEAEPLMRLVVSIWEKIERDTGYLHPNYATSLNNLAGLLHAGRPGEAEELMHRALAIAEASYGPDHPRVAICLNNLAQLLQSTNRLREAEPLSRRQLKIFLEFTRHTGHEHPHLRAVIQNHAGLLGAMGKTEQEVAAEIEKLAREVGLEIKIKRPA